MNPQTKKQLNKIKARLEKLELAQLREAVTEMHEKISSLETQLNNAQGDADFWHEQSQQIHLILENSEEVQYHVGITQQADTVITKNKH